MVNFLISSGWRCGCSPLVDRVEKCRTAGFPAAIGVVVTRTRLHESTHYMCFFGKQTKIRLIYHYIWWWNYCWSYFINIFGRNYWWLIELERLFVICMQKSCSWPWRYNQDQKSTLKWVSQKLVLLIYISLPDISQPGLGICLQNIEPPLILQKQP